MTKLYCVGTIVAARPTQDDNRGKYTAERTVPSVGIAPQVSSDYNCFTVIIAITTRYVVDSFTGGWLRGQ